MLHEFISLFPTAYVLPIHVRVDERVLPISQPEARWYSELMPFEKVMKESAGVPKC